MHPLLEQLYNIRNQFVFQQSKDGLMAQIGTDPQLATIRNRLQTILNDQQRSWYERAVLAGNLLLDPRDAQGGFFVRSYAQYVLESFLNGILRRHGFGVGRPWSFIELELDEREMDYLRSFPAGVISAQGQHTPELGAIAFLSESLYLSDTYAAAEVWPVIRAIGWSPDATNLWFLNGAAEQAHKNLLSRGIQQFGIRNALGDPDGNAWVRTFTLQFGISLTQWQAYVSGTRMPIEPEGVAAQLLMNENNNLHSTSFKETWRRMRKICSGGAPAYEAERVMEQSPWIRKDWIPDLLEKLAKRTRGIVIGAEADDAPLIVNPETVFSGPKLDWTNGTPRFVWQVNPDILAFLAPEDCTELDIFGPSGRNGRLGRINRISPWTRISGLHLTGDLQFAIPLEEFNENEICLMVSNDASCFRFHQSFLLWHSADLVTRFGRGGLIHASAWKRALPAGEEFSLRLEAGARVGPDPSHTSLQDNSGLKWVHFEAGWQQPVTVSAEDGTVIWDSADLAAPSRSLTADQRNFRTLLVIDRVFNNVISAHLEIHGANPSSVSIENDQRSFDELRRPNSLQFGKGHRPLAEIWRSIRVQIRILGQNGHGYLLPRAAELTPRQLNHPFFLGRWPTGEVFLLDSERIETMEQLGRVQIRAVTPQGTGSAFLQQHSRPVSQIESTTIQVDTARCIGRGLPMDYGFVPNPGDAMTSGSLMRGVTERGVIRTVGNFESLIGTFDIELTDPVEPDQAHQILVLSECANQPGQRLIKTTVTRENLEPSTVNGWQRWKVTTGAPLKNVLGVAICYGEGLIGCWSKGGPNAIQGLLSAQDLQLGEVGVLADFIQWFHVPVFAGQGLETAVIQFFRSHAAAVLFRWANEHRLDWNGFQLSKGIREPQWEQAVRILAIRANHAVGGPLTYKGLDQQIAGQAGDAWPMVRKLIELAPGCASRIDWQQHVHQGRIAPEKVQSLNANVPNDHNQLRQFSCLFWSIPKNERPSVSRYYQEPDQVRREMSNNLIMTPDPDWAELRRDLALAKKKQGAVDCMLDLWINPTHWVNAALRHGLSQINGLALGEAQTAHLQELMLFPSFARLLARKVLNQGFHIPHP